MGDDHHGPSSMNAPTENRTTHIVLKPVFANLWHQDACEWSGIITLDLKIDLNIQWPAYPEIQCYEFPGRISGANFWSRKSLEQGTKWKYANSVSRMCRWPQSQEFSAPSTSIGTSSIFSLINFSNLWVGLTPVDFLLILLSFKIWSVQSQRSSLTLLLQANPSVDFDRGQ